jgi:hypothetical protein
MQLSKYTGFSIFSEQFRGNTAPSGAYRSPKGSCGYIFLQVRSLKTPGRFYVKAGQLTLKADQVLYQC